MSDIKPNVKKKERQPPDWDGRRRSKVVPRAFQCDEPILHSHEEFRDQGSEAEPEADFETTMLTTVRAIAQSMTQCLELLQSLNQAAPSASARLQGDFVGNPLTFPRAAYQLRRARENVFPDLFAEPAWDILLYMFECNRVGRPVTVTDACAAAAVPPTTGLRCIGVLTDHGLIERNANDHDRRTFNLTLTEEGLAQMDEWVAQASRGLMKWSSSRF